MQGCYDIRDMNRIAVVLDIPVGGIIAIAVSVSVVLILLFILLHLTVFAHARTRKAVRELTRKYEYLHGLFFGQDNQFVRRLEIISRTNLLYVDIHMRFNKRYREIRDKDDASATAAINRIKDMVSDRKWKDLKDYFPEVKNQIGEYEARVNSLNTDLVNVIKPEEECRQASLALKEQLRKIKQDYYVKQADLTLLSQSFDAVFANLENTFSKFELFVESAQYQDAKELLPKISAVIDQLGKIFPLLPGICAVIQSAIPDKIISLTNRYEEMIRGGYPLFHLMSRDDIQAMENQLKNITKRVQRFDLRGVQAELDGILARIDDYFEGCKKEEQAKKTFEDECEEIYQNESAIEKKYIRLCNALPQVKRIFVISGEEQSKIDGIKNQINKAGATKRSLDTFIHSGTHQPYSLLVERMHQLRDEAEQAQNAIDDFERYLNSLKEDSEGALHVVQSTYSRLKEAEDLVRQIDLEAVSSRYDPAIDELYGLLDECHKSLNSTPIDARKIDELVAKIKGTGEELVKNITRDHQQMMLSEAAIVFANRERNHFGEVNTLLLQTEGLYFSGDFARSYDETLKELKRRHVGE